MIKKLKLELDKLKLIESIFDVNNAHKRIKSKKLSVKKLKILKSLAKWREKLAQKINIPRNWVVSDKLIMQVVREKNSKLNTKDKNNRNFNSKIEDFNKFLEIKKLI